MKYKATNVIVKEVNTKFGPKKSYRAILVDPEGHPSKQASCWTELKEGGEYEGELVVNGEYLNFEIKGNLAKTGAKRPDIEKAMDRKEESIDKAMTRKEDSFETSATFRDATLITTAQFTGQTFTDEAYRAKWRAWRRWLVENYSQNSVDQDIQADNLGF